MPSTKQKVNISSLKAVLKNRYLGPYLYSIFWKVFLLFLQNVERMGDLSE